VSIATSTAIALGVTAAAGIGAAGSIAASSAQSNAANNAASIQQSDQNASIAEQQREFNINQQNQAPWLQAGTQGIGALSGLLSTPGQGLLTPWTQQFQAPTADQAAQTPGYQFQLQQGNQAIQNSAAAQGGLLSGNTLTAMDQYSQGLASTNYQQVYNNALQQYQQSYNIFQGNQSNEFNRLAALSGIGQTTATSLGNQGQAAASNIANINSSSGAQIGNSLMAAGGAQASGYAGIANSLSGGASGLGQYALLNSLLGSNNASGLNQTQQLQAQMANTVYQ
jgi:hypothetical protein